MNALILAAGLGTRLRPLTIDTPKCLVPVGGVPMLERVARKLIGLGVKRLVINAHHHADQVVRFVEAKSGFGVDTHVLVESPAPLETGGGLWNARDLLRGSEPFWVHNADIETDAPLRPLLVEHRNTGALATLAVMDRPSTRSLLFDAQGLVGRTDLEKDLVVRVRASVGSIQSLSFAGIHCLSPGILDEIEERGIFSILEPYLRLAGRGARIAPFRVDGCRWTDIGTHAEWEKANAAASRTALVNLEDDEG